jgi:hypothetical protein
MKFETYLKELASHEREKYEKYLSDPRSTILVFSGVALNWLGDFFANPDIKWVEKTVKVEDVVFTGTNPKMNDILLIKCEEKPDNLVPYLEKNPEDKKYVYDLASYGDEPILLRQRDDKYLLLDGTHRFLGAVLQGNKEVRAFVPTNEQEVLPDCEAHTVYDLIRGFRRNARDEEGKKALYYGLKLLKRTYANVETLLRERFNEKYERNKEVQDVISKVLNNEDYQTESDNRK